MDPPSLRVSPALLLPAHRSGMCRTGRLLGRAGGALKAECHPSVLLSCTAVPALDEGIGTVSRSLARLEHSRDGAAFFFFNTNHAFALLHWKTGRYSTEQFENDYITELIGVLFCRNGHPSIHRMKENVRKKNERKKNPPTQAVWSARRMRREYHDDGDNLLWLFGTPRSGSAALMCFCCPITTSHAKHTMTSCISNL